LIWKLTSCVRSSPEGAKLDRIQAKDAKPLQYVRGHCTSLANNHSAPLLLKPIRCVDRRLPCWHCSSARAGKASVRTLRSYRVVGNPSYLGPLNPGCLGPLRNNRLGQRLFGATIVWGNEGATMKRTSGLLTGAATAFACARTRRQHPCAVFRSIGPLLW
jgi:hypothetical protein